MRNKVVYRAKDSRNLSIFHTGGLATNGRPLENRTMKGLAESIAYLYSRHNVILYESEDGRSFHKVDEKKQKRFDLIMADELYKDENRC